MKKLVVLLTILACSTGLGSAQIMVTTSASAPTPGADDIYQLANDGTVTNSGSTAVWSDQFGQGQSFTTSTNAGGYTLNSVSVLANGTGGNGSAGPLILDIGTYTGGVFTLIPGDMFTASGTTDVSSISGQPNSGLWLTYTLTTPITLSANTSYGFALGAQTGGAGYLLAKDSSSTYSGGTAFSTSPNGNPDGGLNGPITGTTVNGFNRTFDIGLTADAVVPEPSTYVLFGLGFLGLVALRKYRQTV